MHIVYDKYGNPIKYQQKIDALSEPLQFDPEEIVHFKIYDIDGKVYGFTPVRALFRELEIMQLVKEVAIRGFSGYPSSKIFILPEDAPGSANHKHLTETLKLMGDPGNRFRSMVLTGNVQTMDASPPIKDMEFKQLAMYITQVIVMTWGVPSSRLSGLLSLEKSGNATTSSEGYYRKISHMQDIIEDMLNVEIFDSFNVRLAFNRTYKQDEVREAQVEKIKTDICEQRLKLHLVKPEWAWDYLNIREEDRGDGEQMDERTGLNNQDLLNKHQVLSEPAKLADDKKKQDIQKSKV
jgi:hypothetical protein